MDALRLIPPPRAGHRVLVAEDVPVLRRAYAHALRRDGYEVTEVSDGAEALEVLDAARPDVVVTEVAMPTMDGIALVRALRRREVAVPVLFVADDDFLRFLALRAGGDGFLVQPFGPEELLARVAALTALGARRPVERRSLHS